MGRVSKDPKVLAKKERRAKMQELLKNLEVKDMNDINDLFKEMVGAVLKNGQEGELEEELGYSKYDYKNRDTGNYRNGHSKKTMKTSSMSPKLVFIVFLLCVSPHFKIYVYFSSFLFHVSRYIEVAEKALQCLSNTLS